MIKKFVETFEKGRKQLEEKYSVSHPESYGEIVKDVVKMFDGKYGVPDSERIHRIDDGDYQGTLVFVVAEKGYQPCRYWYVRIGYGSCSGCDTLAAITGFGDEKPTTEQTSDYMSLALHIIQRFKEMGEEYV